jgi:valyl-tRNA synthetase
MKVETESLKGKKVAEARALVVEWLKSEGLLEKEEDIEHNIATAERTGGIVEPLPKLQWFIDVNKKFKSPKGEKTLKEMMLDAVKSGGVKIIPDRFEKVYYHWIENLRDWCISRQIWYGHRIPVWYRKQVSSGKLQAASEESTELYVGVKAPEGDGWEQDSDTLDTWFSSGLWTFSTLGWPEDSADLRNYHPTTILETGYDILFFWVARMILMSGYLLGEVPFKTVYLHGLVRDKEGRKLSKSLGNNLDPVDVIKKYGADALRMSLIVGTGPGNDSKMSEDKLKAYKHFANKLWNIGRFVLTNTEGIAFNSDFEAYTETDKKLRDEHHALLADVTSDMEAYRLYLAAEKLYHYAWHTFADKLIEESKPILENGSPEEKSSRQQFLLHTFDKILRALHPFMPFVTESLWSTFAAPEHDKLLMIASWPKTDEQPHQ